MNVPKIFAPSARFFKYRTFLTQKPFIFARFMTLRVQNFRAPAAGNHVSEYTAAGNRIVLVQYEVLSILKNMIHRGVYYKYVNSAPQARENLGFIFAPAARNRVFFSCFGPRETPLAC